MKVEITKAPVAKTEMLIRKHAAEVVRGVHRSPCDNQLLVHQEQRPARGRS